MVSRARMELHVLTHSLHGPVPSRLKTGTRPQTGSWTRLKIYQVEGRRPKITDNNGAYRNFKLAQMNSNLGHYEETNDMFDAYVGIL